MGKMPKFPKERRQRVNTPSLVLDSVVDLVLAPRLYVVGAMGKQKNMAKTGICVPELMEQFAYFPSRLNAFC